MAVVVVTQQDVCCVVLICHLRTDLGLGGGAGGRGRGRAGLRLGGGLGGGGRVRVGVGGRVDNPPGAHAPPPPPPPHHPLTFPSHTPAASTATATAAASTTGVCATAPPARVIARRTAPNPRASRRRTGTTTSILCVGAVASQGGPLTDRRSPTHRCWATQTLPSCRGQRLRRAPGVSPYSCSRVTRAQTLTSLR